MPTGTLTFHQSFGPLTGLEAIRQIASGDDYIVYADDPAAPTLRVVFSVAAGIASSFVITNGDGTATYAAGDFGVSLTALDEAIDQLDADGVLEVLFADLSVVALAAGAIVDLAPFKEGLTLQGNALGTEFLLGHYSATLNAGEGDDTIVATASSTGGSVDGGDGYDTLVLSGAYPSVSVALDYGTVTFFDDIGGEWSIANIEFFRGSAGQDYFASIGDGRRFEGAQGDDQFIRRADTPDFGDTIDYSLEEGGSGIAVILELFNFNIEDVPTGIAAALHDLLGDADVFAGKIRDTYGHLDDVPPGFNIVGSARADVYYGWGGADVFDGGDGDDDIFGGDGDDTIDGGEGDHDTFYLSQARAAYAPGDITYDKGVFTIVSSGGTDKVTGIEHFAFSDVTVDASDFMPPAAHTDSGSVTEAGVDDAGVAAASGNALDNDDNASEVDGIRAGDSGELTIVGVATVVVGTFGTLTIARTGEWSYTLTDLDPETNALATGATAHDIFTYRIDGALGDVATIDITIAGSNDAPTTTHDSFYVDEDAALVFAASGLTANDSDPEGALTVTSVQDARNGTVQLSAGVVTFVPATGFAGRADFTYTVKDAQGVTATEQVTVTVFSVNDAPNGTGGRIAVLEDGSVSLSAASFGFDDGADGNALLSVIITALPAKGELRLGSTPVAVDQHILVDDLDGLNWTPPAGESGTGLASFGFRVRDDGGTANNGIDTDPSAGTIVFDVTPVNDAPDGAGGTLTVLEDSALAFSAADFGFSDSDGHDLMAVIITTLPTTGTLTLGGVAVAANQEIPAASLSALRWTPDAGLNGPNVASIGFKVRDTGGTADGGGDTDPTAGMISIDVTSVNDAPTGAGSTITVNEDASHSFVAADFGFSDSDGGSLSAVVVVSLPATGTLKLGGTEVTAGQVIPVGQIGSLTWTPPADVAGDGLASFTFKVRDDGGTADGGVDTDPTARTVVFNVRAVNDAPSGAGSTITLNEDTARSFTASDFGFSDSDGGSLSAIIVSTLPGTGTLTLGGTDVTAGQVIALGQISNLTWTPPANASGNGLASFTFRVRDDGGTANGGIDTDPTARTIVFNVAAVNDAPSGAGSTITVNEDTARSFTASDFGFSDSDGGSLSAVVIVTLPAAGALTLGGTAVTAGQVIPVGQVVSLTWTPPVNSSGNGLASLTFKVRDDSGTANGGIDSDPTARTIVFNVMSVNDAPSGAGSTITLNEDASHSFATADFGFSDSDGGSLSAVVIVTLPAAGTLKLGGTAVTAGQVIPVGQVGSLTWTPPVNASGNSLASFTFKVRDDGGTANGGIDTDPTAKTIVFNVRAVNDAPSGAGSTINLNEDTTRSFTASDFGFGDSDGGSLSAVVVVSLPAIGTLKLGGTAVTAGQVIPVGQVGSLTWTPPVNASGNSLASFTFKVCDDGGTANGGVDTDPTARTLVFNVRAVNDAPSGSGSTITVNEDSTRSFDASDFGFSDSDGGSLSAVVVVTLPATGTLKLGGTEVTAGQVIAASQLGALTWSPPANASGNGLTSFTFKVRDDGGTANGGIDTDPTARTIVFNVTSVNDAPSGAGSTITLNEDASHSFATADFGFDDGDGGSLSAVVIVTLPATGTLKLGGTAVTAGQVIAAGQIGNLTWTPPANASGSGLASFTFKVRDDGGTANGGIDTDLTARTLVFNVRAVNDAPSGVGSTITLNEDTAHSFDASDLGFSDSDGGSLSAVVIVTLPAAGTLKLGGTAVTAGQVIPVGQVGSLTWTPPVNASGNSLASFTFKVRDDGGTANGGVDTDPTARTIVFNVMSVNDAPSGAGSTITLNEDAAHTFDASDFGFDDSDGGSLSAVVVVTLPATGTLKLGGTAVTAGQVIPVGQVVSLTWTPPADASGNGLASFTFKVRDDGGTANGGVDTDPTARTIVFNVTSVNDAPSGAGSTITLNEDAAHTFDASDFGFDDSDGGSLSAVVVVTLPATGTLKLGGTAVTAGQVIPVGQVVSLTWTPPVNSSGNGLASLTFKVRDDGGTANGGVDTDPTARTMVFNVRAVNDAPSGAGSTINLNEDTTRSFTASDFGFDDSDGGSLSAVVVVSLPAIGTLKLGGTEVTAGQVIPVGQVGSLTWTPPANASGDGLASFTFKVRDDGGTANGGIDTDPTARSIRFDVLPVNDAPASAGRVITIAEDGSHVFSAADFAFTDSDAGDVLQSVTITSLPDGTLALGGVAVTTGQSVAVGQLSQLTFTPSADANGSPLTSFSFTVSDGGLASSARTMTINVGPANDAPVARDDVAISTNEDTPLTITASALQANDSDIDSAILAIDSVASAEGGSVVLNDDGTITFTPLADFSGTARFSYRVRDDKGALSETAFVTVNVTAVNDPPVFVREGGIGPQAVRTVVEGRLNVFSPEVGDVDDVTLTYELAGSDADKFVFFEGELRFAVAPDFERPADIGDDNVYNVTIVASDGEIFDTLDVAVTVLDAVGNSINGTGKGDRVDLATKIKGKAATDEQDAIDGRGGNDTIASAAGDDTLKGGAGDDSLSGEGGDDRLQGGAGRDTLDGGAGMDIADYTATSGPILLTLKASGASARVGGVVEDWVISVEGVIGGKGNDILAGDRRANVLDGGLGNDTLTGGGGRDTFAFTGRIKSGNADVIVDFKPGTDRIALDDAIFRAIGSNLSPGAFYSKAGATKAHDAGDRIIYDRTSGKLFYDDDGNKIGGHAPVHFATLSSKLALGVDDFVIV